VPGQGRQRLSRREELALRLAGQDVARSVVSLLRSLNLHPLVHGRAAALRTLLAFPHAVSITAFPYG
jgi:hypothetical protein